MNYQLRTKNTPVLKIAVGVVVIAIVMIMMQFEYSKTIAFKDPEVIRAVYRGPDGDVQPAVYTDEQLSGFVSIVQVAIAESYESDSDTRWVLGSSVQELFDGSIAVGVTAYDNATDEMIDEWALESAAKDDALSAELNAFGVKVAGDLAAAVAQ